MVYATTKEVWDYLNLGTKIREEVVITSGDGTTSVYSLTNSNLINTSITLKTGTNYLNTSGTVSTSSYSMNLDDGYVTLSASIITGGASGNYIWADYHHTIIPDSVMVEFISASDKEIDRMTRRNWLSGSEITESISVVDKEQTDYYTKHFPHITISEIAENESDASNTPNWTTRSEGLGNDYLNSQEDKGLGRFRFIDNRPAVGTDNLRVKYQHGFIAVPKHINRASILFTIRDMLNNPSFSKAMMEGRDVFYPLNTDVIEAELKKVISQLTKFSFDKI